MQKKYTKKTEVPYVHAKKKTKNRIFQMFIIRSVRCVAGPFGSGGGVFNFYYGGDEELLRLGQLKLDLGSSALAPGRPRPIDSMVY